MSEDLACIAAGLLVARGTIGFGPDGFLYVSIGSSCNVCIESDPRRAAISRYDPATWRGSIFAWMTRNAGDVTSYFCLPPNGVVELGARVEV